MNTQGSHALDSNAMSTNARRCRHGPLGRAAGVRRGKPRGASDSAASLADALHHASSKDGCFDGVSLWRGYWY